MSARATLPPPGLPGLDAGFSRIVAVPGVGVDHGVVREWHCLDTGAELTRLGVPVVGTMLAVHGNPTWSYLWRALLTQSVHAAERGEPAWRVVAVDQLDMGFSDRTDEDRPLAQRVADLGAFTAALGLDTPVVTLGHDWGGVVSAGWAIDHPESLAGVVLLNTAVHHPDGVPIPAPLRLAGARGVLAASTVATTAFLDTTLALATPAVDAATRRAYRTPYGSATRRRAIGGFVADIPADGRHPSHPELERIAAGVAELDVPALLLWGPEDPIFSDRYLDDLLDRLPHADVHRFEGASHLVAEDRPYAEAVLTWLREHGDRLTSPGATAPARPVTATDSDGSGFTPIWHGLQQRRADDETAIVDMSPTRSGATRRVTWRQLDDRVRRLAAGLHRIGVRKGDRVSLLVPPGPTLSAVVYACLRIGAVIVVADAGLGIRGLTRAVRGSWPDFIIGETLGLTAARALGWPGVRISAARLPKAASAALGVTCSLSDILAQGTGEPLPEPPGPGDDAAILFTSGSTGPAKGVAYTHGQLSALRDVLADHFGVTPQTGLVTGFAPFALLGPALGTRSVTPQMDVSSPRTLTATAVAAAVRESGAGIVFLSPAAVLNVVATAGALTEADRAALAGVHTFLSTGAPISPRLLESAAEIMPNATPHTPYGMTECLLVTDVTLDGVHDAAQAPDAGVCVGVPIGANRVLVSALDADGRATGTPTAEPGVLGEIVVSAPHLKDHYDRLWLTDREAARGTEGLDPVEPGARWHRTGDVGHLDEHGRLWVEGRMPHVLVTEHGPLAPVGPEQEVERVDAVRRAAVVGVGPHGLRQAVAVVETIPPTKRATLADPDLTAAVRGSTRTPLVAVLAVPHLPTDIRHNSKIDRSRLSRWAERILAGGRPAAP
ncbi:alpha/beta fold hydrolase [Microbacterium lushaniae]|nr:alpha/beta fold hydrolase [Microbacterium lushaniae]KAA9158306.1 alpha/beta fold hydrolase [Microbacterium lushaniae]